MTTRVSVSSIQLVLQGSNATVSTPIRCFTQSRGGEPLCAIDVPRVVASVAMMEHQLRRLQPEVFTTHFLVGEDDPALCVTPLEEVPDGAIAAARVSMVRYLAGLNMLPRDQVSLGFTNATELSMFAAWHATTLQAANGAEAEAADTPLFPTVHMRSPQTDVPLCVYEAHEVGGGSDDPEQALKELEQRIATKKNELKELLRKRYRTFAVLQKAEGIMVSSLQTLGPEVEGLYAAKSDDRGSEQRSVLHDYHRAVHASNANHTAPDQQQQASGACTGYRCVICFDDDEGAYPNCENAASHPADIVYCRACADMVTQEGVCPICRGDIL